MMSNKKGFVLIETIVTIVVLAMALLYIYSEFNDVLIKDKTRVHYDDVAHMYHTFYVKEYFMQYDLRSVLKNLNEDSPMIIIGCDYEDAGITLLEKNTCDSIINTLGISKITVALGNLSYIQGCNNFESDKCSYLQNFNDEEIAYLKTLGDLSEDNRYVMIIEYSEDKILNTIDDNKKIHNNYNYAWVRI